jgi:hypothetical protein
MNIIISTKNYTPFQYKKYICGREEVRKPTSPSYHVGQVVIVEKENEQPEAAVVLGCIDEKHKELRVDLCGMVCFDDIRPATKEDLKNDSILFSEKLLAECEGKIVHFDWKTYELKISENEKKTFVVSTEKGRNKGVVNGVILKLENKFVHLSDFDVSVQMNKGIKAEVVSKLVELKELPEDAVDSSGYPNYDKVSELANIVIIEGQGLNYYNTL